MCGVWPAPLFRPLRRLFFSPPPPPPPARAEEHAGSTLHFVEDRLATLRKVVQDGRLADWNLYLVDWGYNTPEERAQAAAEGIRVISTEQFAKLLATGDAS